LDELQVSEELSQQQEQMKALAREYRTLQAKLDEAVKEIENRVPIHHHQSSINECKT
jgi:predicted  nucleic acid-binding Zn-ribbon protein